MISFAACRRNLEAISAALRAYQKDRGGLPDHLSDLAPAYLRPEELHCPSDHSPGTIGPRPRVRGADTVEVLTAAGVEPAQIDALLDNGVIGGGMTP